MQWVFGFLCLKAIVDGSYMLSVIKHLFLFVFIVKHFDIPKSEEDCRWKLREYFYRNACVTDIRVIDMLVIKVIHVCVTIYKPTNQP